MQKLGDALVMVVGLFFQNMFGDIRHHLQSVIVCIRGRICSSLLFAAVMVAIGGGAALISMFPTFNVVLPTSPLSAIVMYIAGLLLVGIPLVSLVWAIFCQIFKWQPMVSGLKWTFGYSLDYKCGGGIWYLLCYAGSNIPNAGSNGMVGE